VNAPLNLRAGRRQGATALQQRGFGLVEVMVALVLGLFVVGGAVVLLMTTRQANSATENLSRVQDSVRTSFDLVSREIREAGSTPCDAQQNMANVLHEAQATPPAWWASWDEPVRGYGGSTAFPGAAFGSAVGERVDGTSAILARYGSPTDSIAVTSHDTASATFTMNKPEHSVRVNDVVMVCNYRNAAIFRVTAVDTTAGTVTHAESAGAPGNCSKGLGMPTDCSSATGHTYQFTPGSLFGRFTTVGWYIGNNGRAGSGGRSLYRVTRLGVEEVADGVRDMQITYLTPAGTDYVVATSVSNWSEVLAVRFDISFESPEATAGTGGTAQRLNRDVGFTVNLRNLQP
jgi:type IV pilus assembly protein PilW